MFTFSQIAERARSEDLKRFLNSLGDVCALPIPQKVAASVELVGLLRAEIKLLPNFQTNPSFPAVQALMDSLIPLPHPAMNERTVRELAGVIFGLSGYIVSKACVIKQMSPSIFERVVSGEITVTAGHRLALGGEEKSPQQDKIEHAAMRRIEQGIAVLSGTIRALSVDVPKIRSACGQREINEIVAQTKRIRKAILRFEEDLGYKTQSKFMRNKENIEV